MTDEATPEVVAILEDETGMRRVEVIHHPQGHFTYAEFHQDESSAAADDEVWQEVVAPESKTYKTEYAAYSAALREVEWLFE